MQFLSLEQVAAAAGITVQRVARIIREFGNDSRAFWHGSLLEIETTEQGPRVAFHTLPDHIREAFVMTDQRELPLPPLWNKLNWNPL